MDTTIIIPARYGSRRFPGKPMAKILGKPMIEWVWRAAMATKDRSRRVKSVIVATDSEEIQRFCAFLGAWTELTDLRHSNGTSRCLEVCDRLGLKGGVMILQGDEPLASPELLCSMLERVSPIDPHPAPVSACCKFSSRREREDPNAVKVVLGHDWKSLYFSRTYLEGSFRHIGIYLYDVWALKMLSEIKPGPLEVCERLEQLRVLEWGWKFKMVEWVGEPRTISVDVPEDIPRVEEEFRRFTSRGN